MCEAGRARGRDQCRGALGGAVIGVAGGFTLLGLLKILQAKPGIFPVLAFAGALTIFGGAELLETSGFSDNSFFLFSI